MPQICSRNTYKEFPFVTKKATFYIVAPALLLLAFNTKGIQKDYPKKVNQKCWKMQIFSNLQYLSFSVIHEK